MKASLSTTMLTQRQMFASRLYSHHSSNMILWP